MGLISKGFKPASSGDIMKLKLLALACTILGILIACTPISIPTPELKSIPDTIKVGETATITLVLPTKQVIGGNTTFTYETTGFIYSPNSSAPSIGNHPTAPYQTIFSPAPDAFLKGSEPALFPVSNIVSIINPVTDTSNVPARVLAMQSGELSQVRFTVRGERVGSAIIRGAFVFRALEYPEIYNRVPVNPRFEAEVILKVIP
jgi:hypothetical protein